MTTPPELVWQCRDRRLVLGRRPLVLGIVNVTPDSFSDGGRFHDPCAAVEHGLRLVAEGADLLDVGGESTRPGSQPVPADEQLRRVLPVVRELVKQSGVPISVDTTNAEVARHCLGAGATVINDVTGLRGDPDMPALAGRTGAGVIVMHMQGTPATMQVAPKYADVVAEVREFFEERLTSLTAVGVSRDAIALDPGIGFGKTTEHNLRLLANLDHYRRFGRPLCLGASRKGFAGRLCNRPNPEDRMPASLAVACFAVAANAAHVLRVHDVAPTRDAVVLWDAISQYRDQP